MIRSFSSLDTKHWRSRENSFEAIFQKILQHLLLRLLELMTSMMFEYLLTSELNALVQLTAEKYVVPQISHESHVTDMSNVKEYPYFLRMSASQDLVSIALLKLIEKYRYVCVYVLMLVGNDSI